MNVTSGETVTFERDFGRYAPYAMTETDAELASYVGDDTARRHILAEVVWVELGEQPPTGCVDSVFEESIMRP